MKGRRRPRAGTANNFPEAGLVLVRPDFLPARQVEADDCFRFAALLLRKDALANYRKGRPAGADSPPPQLAGRMSGPIGLNANAAHIAVALAAAELGPIRLCGNKRSCR